MMNLETRGVLCEDIGRQVITLGRRIEGSELCERIKKIEGEELMHLARTAMSQNLSLSMLNGIASDNQ